MARSLGLDVGKRRIGIATSDMLKVIARPLDIIDRHKQDAIGAIVTHITVQQADELVVGYPVHANGAISEQARSVERFIDALRPYISIPIVYSDERYSTGEAREIMSAKRRHDNIQSDDSIAAAVILQRYLDKRFDTAGKESEDERFAGDE